MTLKEAKELILDEIESCEVDDSDLYRGNVAGLRYALSVLSLVTDHTTTCLNCGKDFTPNDPYHQKFCSLECKKAYKKAKEQK